MKTYTLKPQDIERRWWLVDAAEQPLGRLASRIAQILRGKHKPTFTPHVNGGDFVIVINAEKVQLTGRKVEQKRYFRHTGRSEEHTSELQSRLHLVCRLLLEKKKRR